MPKKKYIGVKLTLERQESVRSHIQAHSLVERLNNHALGLLKRPMSDSQVRTALGLLKKVLPDLQSVEISTGENDKRFVIVAVAQDGSIEKWANEYGYQRLNREEVVVDGEFKEVNEETVRLLRPKSK